MPIRVTLKDRNNAVVSFPDDASEEEIQSILNRDYPTKTSLKTKVSNAISSGVKTAASILAPRETPTIAENLGGEEWMQAENPKEPLLSKDQELDIKERVGRERVKGDARIMAEEAIAKAGEEHRKEIETQYKLTPDVLSRPSSLFPKGIKAKSLLGFKKEVLTPEQKETMGIEEAPIGETPWYVDPVEMAAMGGSFGLKSAIKPIEDVTAGLLKKTAIRTGRVANQALFGFPGIAKDITGGVARRAGLVLEGAAAKNLEKPFRGGIAGVMSGVSPEANVSQDVVKAGAKAMERWTPAAAGLTTSTTPTPAIKELIQEPDLSKPFVHVRNTYERVKGILDPIEHWAGVHGDKEAKYYKDVFVPRTYAFKHEDLVANGFDTSKLDKMISGRSWYIGRTDGPILPIKSEEFKNIMEEAQQRIIADGFAPGDQQAFFSYVDKIAVGRGYAGLDRMGKQGYIFYKPQRVASLEDAKMKMISDYHAAKGGFTYNVMGDQMIEGGKGWSVSIGRIKQFKGDQLTRDEIRQYILDNSDELTKGNVNLGGWLDKDAGLSELALSKKFTSKDEAMGSARALGEKYIWDHAKGESIPVGEEAAQVLESAPRLGAMPTTVKKVVDTGETTRLSDIEKYLNESFNVDAIYGRVHKKGVLGFLSPDSGVIRTRFINDIETRVHEIAHKLQKAIGKDWAQNVDMTELQGMAAFKTGGRVLGQSHYLSELQPIASKGKPKWEGFAEFLKMYVTDPANAQAKAPGFYKYFDEMTETEYPIIRNILLNARESYTKYLEQPNLTKLSSRFRSPADVKRPGATFDNLYTALVNKDHPLEQAVKALGKPATSLQDPTLLNQLMRGFDGKPDAFVNHGVLDFSTLTKIGPSLRERTKPVNKMLDEFKDYMILRRAEDYLQRGKASGFSPETIMGARAEISKDPQKEELFRRTFEEVQDWSNSVLKYLFDSGFGTPEQLEQVIARNPSYVPFYLLQESALRGSRVGIHEKGMLFTPLKKLRGMGDFRRDVGGDYVDPLEAMIKNSFSYIRAAEENRLRQSFLALAKTSDDFGHYISPVAKDIELAAQAKYSAFFDDIIKRYGETMPDFKAMAEDLKQTMGDQVINIWKAASVPVNANEPIINIWQNGVQKWYRVDPELYQVMARIHDATPNLLEKVMSPFTRTLKAGATLSMEFMGRNIFRDQPTAMINSQFGYKMGIDSVRGMLHAMKKDDVYWAWKVAGGDHASFVDVVKSSSQLAKDVAEPGFKLRDLNPLNALEYLAQLGEEGTRLGEFERGLKTLGTGINARLTAAGSSRDVTLDFGRMGAKIGLLNNLIAFFNPNIQGSDKMIRQLITEGSMGRRSLSIAKGLIGLTMPAMGLWALQHDDPRWELLPEYHKRNSLIFFGNRVSGDEWNKMNADEKAKFASDTTWRVPVPPGLGHIFATIPVAMMESLLDKDPEILPRMQALLVDAFMPNMVPTAVGPWLENWMNYSFYMQKSLVPQTMIDKKSGVIPGYRSFPFTTSISKEVGKQINTSPILIENIVRGYTGGLGMTALRGLSSMLDAALEDESTPQKPSKSWSDIPGVGGFSVRFPAGSMDLFERFNKITEKMQQEQNTIKNLAVKEMNVKEATDLLSEFDQTELKRWMFHRKTLQHIEETLANGRKLITVITNHPRMEGQLKKEKIEAIYLTMAEAAKVGVDLMSGKEPKIDVISALPEE